MKTRRRRLYFHLMEKFDRATGSCFVREMEMTVDGALASGHTAYSVQFWRDVQLYGLAEAVLYLRNGNYCRDPEALAEVEKVAGRIVGDWLAAMEPLPHLPHCQCLVCIPESADW